MSVAEIGVLHGRYVRLSDRFKSLWTYHQFASGVFKNLLPAALPYRIDFQNTYDRIKAASVTINSSQVQEAGAAVGLCELALDRISTQLLRADEQVSASIVRRFFEKVKRQDESIVLFLIKFYFYADALEGDFRDKLDYLFTRIGEDFVPDRAQYSSRDSLEFRERLISLVSLLRPIDAPHEEHPRGARPRTGRRRCGDHCRSPAGLLQRGRTDGEHLQPLRERSASASISDSDRCGDRSRQSGVDARRNRVVSEHQRAAPRTVGDRRVSETVRPPRAGSGRRQRGSLGALHARRGAAHQS